MPRYIDADALKYKIEQHSYPLSDRINSIENGMFLCGIYQAIDESTTADVVPVVRGEWICNPDDKKFSLVCSVCGQVMPFVPEYLPDNPPFCNCGADMRGSEVKE